LIATPRQIEAAKRGQEAICERLPGFPQQNGSSLTARDAYVAKDFRQIFAEFPQQRS